MALARLSVGADAHADDDDDDETPPDVSDGAAGAAEPEAAPAPPPEAAEKAALRGWTAYALTHQLAALGASPPSGSASVAELAELYWTALVGAGKEGDEMARCFLVPPPEAADAADSEPYSKLWIECLLGAPPPPGPLMAQLKSGEVLCDLLNVLRPGLVSKVARAHSMAELHVSKRNAQMRENIGQYVDGCAELGVPQRDLFMTADLFDDKDHRAVTRHLEGLARFAQEGLPTFHGPYIGKKAKKKPAGGTPGALPGCYSALSHQQQGRVVLSGGATGGKYQAFVGGRGNM